VDLRLVIIQPDARSFEEFTTFLGRPPRSSVWDAGAETAALRQELKKQAARARQLQDVLDEMQADMVRQQRNRQREAASERR
jgi:hypothetical protein